MLGFKRLIDIVSFLNVSTDVFVRYSLRVYVEVPDEDNFLAMFELLGLNQFTTLMQEMLRTKQ